MTVHHSIEIRNQKCCSLCGFPPTKEASCLHLAAFEDHWPRQKKVNNFLLFYKITSKIHLMTTSRSNLSAPAAAIYLSEQLGGKASHWEIWLANERRPNRVNRMLECESGPGRPRYSEEKLMAFVPVYREKHAAKSAGAANQSTGKTARLNASAYPYTDDTDPTHRGVLFVTMNPLRTYKLTVEETRQLSRKLANAADEALAGTGEVKEINHD